MMITIPGPPVGKGRPRFVRATGHTYTPEKTRAYEAMVRQVYRLGRHGDPLQGPVCLEIMAVFPLPKDKRRRSALAGQPYTGKPDIDNVIKVIQDALNGLAYADDKQVTELHAALRYCGEGEQPHVSVIIEEAKP